MNYKNIPEKVLLGLSPIHYALMSNPMIYTNINLYYEIVRQVFKYINQDFDIFANLAHSLPKTNLLQLVDERFLIDSNNIEKLKADTYQFAIGTYLLCRENGLFVDDIFPYLLESVRSDTCLLVYNHIFEESTDYVNTVSNKLNL